MIDWKSVLATTRFEFSRSMTVQRVGALTVLVLFPPVMLAIATFSEGGEFAIMMSGLMVMFIGLLALLLWATPNVHSELEGRSWSYVTTRKGGRFSVFFGKYLNAVLWAVIVCWSSVTLCTLVMMLFAYRPDIVRIWLSMSVLVFIAAPFYGSIFSLIGVVFSRRSMVFGAAYILLSEFALAAIPANINKLTGGFHLFCVSTFMLGWEWIPITESEWESIYGNQSVFVTISFLLIIPLICLGLSALIIRWREYLTSTEMT